MNEFILGGGTEAEMRELLSSRYDAGELDKALKTFAEKQGEFYSLGLVVQGQDSPLIDKIKGYIFKNQTKKNKTISTFNGNGYDIGIFNNVGTVYKKKKLRIEDTVDVYSALQRISRNGILEFNDIAEKYGSSMNVSGRMRQETLAAIYGLDFADTAHNAGSDSVVTGALTAMRDFSEGDRKSVV